MEVNHVEAFAMMGFTFGITGFVFGIIGFIFSVLSSNEIKELKKKINHLESDT